VNVEEEGPRAFTAGFKVSGSEGANVAASISIAAIIAFKKMFCSEYRL
jgi:hypothetical protein